MVGSSLPPGFRFHPTDEELVGYYLHRRNQGLVIELKIIPLLDLYSFDPWKLPEKSFLPNRDLEWFFFCHRDKKYQNGSRISIATKSGYWKATGKDRKIVCDSFSSVTACRKSLVFHTGQAPFGDRTDWVIHEYRLCNNDISRESQNFKGDFVLCRVVKRNELTLKKCEINSPELSNKLLKNIVEIYCQAKDYRQESDLEMSSCDASNTLSVSTDSILDSSFKESSQSQTEVESYFQLFALPEFDYPTEFLADMDFDWQMENPFIFNNYQEAQMNNEVMNYHLTKSHDHTLYIWIPFVCAYTHIV